MPTKRKIKDLVKAANALLNDYKKDGNFTAFTVLDGEKFTKRISNKQYNKEITEAANRIEKGNFVKHKDALKELSKW